MAEQSNCWQSGVAPVAVIMISLNEAHNMDAVLKNLSGWAQEVFLVDSYSADDTVEVALRSGVHVVQRRFRGFGDQWNFALDTLPVTAPWTMKLDPDERLTDELKSSIVARIVQKNAAGISFNRRLWFMGRPLPICQEIVRVWRTGTCRFSDVRVNEHPIVTGRVVKVGGELEHHDSPDLHHWLDKQNKYSTAEAESMRNREGLSAPPRFRGTKIERRMWMKKNFNVVPARFTILFFYYFIIRGLWRAGWVGYTWSRLRVYTMMLRYFKYREMELRGAYRISSTNFGVGGPNPRVTQYD